MHLGYSSDFLIIKGTEEIMMPRPYQYSWTDKPTTQTVITTIRRENLRDTPNQ